MVLLILPHLNPNLEEPPPALRGRLHRHPRLTSCGVHLRAPPPGAQRPSPTIGTQQRIERTALLDRTDVDSLSDFEHPTVTPDCSLFVKPRTARDGRNDEPPALIASRLNRRGQVRLDTSRVDPHERPLRLKPPRQRPPLFKTRKRRDQRQLFQIGLISCLHRLCAGEKQFNIPHMRLRRAPVVVRRNSGRTHARCWDDSAAPGPCLPPEIDFGRERHAPPPT